MIGTHCGACAKSPAGFRRGYGIHFRCRDPGVHAVRRAHRRRLVRVVLDRDVGLQHALIDLWFDKNIADVDAWDGFEEYVLPDSCDGLPPHRPALIGSSAVLALNIEEARFTDSYQQIVVGAELQRIGDVYIERQEDIEVLSYLFAVDNYLGIARDRTEVEQDTPARPRWRNVKLAV